MKVNDLVRCDFDGYARIRKGDRVIITGVNYDTYKGRGSGKKLIRGIVQTGPSAGQSIGSASCGYDAANFKLIQLGDDIMSTSTVRRFAIHSKNGTPRHVDTETELNEYISKLLRENPSSEYHVYEYQRTAKMPIVTFQWHDALATDTRTETA
jgi:hypothetical protein